MVKTKYATSGQGENYRNDTQQTKLPAHQSPRVPRRAPGRIVLYSCDAGEEPFCDSKGGVDLTAASLRAWYPSDHRRVEDDNSWP